MVIYETVDVGAVTPNKSHLRSEILPIFRDHYSLSSKARGNFVCLPASLHRATRLMARARQTLGEQSRSPRTQIRRGVGRCSTALLHKICAGWVARVRYWSAYRATWPLRRTFDLRNMYLTNLKHPTCLEALRAHHPRPEYVYVRPVTTHCGVVARGQGVGTRLTCQGHIET